MTTDRLDLFGAAWTIQDAVNVFSQMTSIGDGTCNDYLVLWTDDPIS